MITAIREVRKAKGMTLADVAAACTPPTTAQTIGRLETGIRTVSIGWINRIAGALGVQAADLVKIPERASLPVAAQVSAEGARAPSSPRHLVAPHAEPGMKGVLVESGLGDYRTGDEIWCHELAPHDFTEALHKDVLVPLPAGKFLFGRLLEAHVERLLILPLNAGAKPQHIAPPAWMGVAALLVRGL
jgi:transcriptional regulator with XRE-family HTH domain